MLHLTMRSLLKPHVFYFAIQFSEILCGLSNIYQQSDHTIAMIRSNRVSIFTQHNKQTIKRYRSDMPPKKSSLTSSPELIVYRDITVTMVHLRHSEEVQSHGKYSNKNELRNCVPVCNGRNDGNTTQATITRLQRSFFLPHHFSACESELVSRVAMQSTSFHEHRRRVVPHGTWNAYSV